MNILFLCKWNRFRSKIAEAYFNKISKKSKAKSAGIIKGQLPLDKYQVEEAKKLRVALKGETQGMDTKLLKWGDLMIIIDKSIPKTLFESKVPITALKGKKIKVVKWNVPDVKFGDRKACKKAIKTIMRKVEELVKKVK
jgi:protein-tyrosine-phosphatase